MSKLYPLSFRPIFKEKVWGGNKLNTKFGLNLGSLSNCGEAWLLSALPGNHSLAATGWLKGNTLKELTEIYMDDLLGEKVYKSFGDTFPMLIKLLDTREWLSVQVHPDQKYTNCHNLSLPKSELWYVLDADPQSELFIGLNPGVDRDYFLSHLQADKLGMVLKKQKVTAGDVFYIPAGCIHALGPGIVLAEIQMASDDTFRIFDWDRQGSLASKRELHLEQALEVIDFSAPGAHQVIPRTDATSVISPSGSPFRVSVLHLTSSTFKNYEHLGSFVIYLCIGGSADIVSDAGCAKIQTGRCVLIPASLDEIQIIPVNEVRILEISMNESSVENSNL